MSTESGQSGGIGFVGVLTIVFIILKLTDVIEWSWWWVLSPIWISVSLVAFMFLIALAIIKIAEHSTKIK